MKIIQVDALEYFIQVFKNSKCSKSQATKIARSLISSDHPQFKQSKNLYYKITQSNTTIVYFWIFRRPKERKWDCVIPSIKKKYLNDIILNTIIRLLDTFFKSTGVKRVNLYNLPIPPRLHKGFERHGFSFYTFMMYKNLSLRGDKPSPQKTILRRVQKKDFKSFYNRLINNHEMITKGMRLPKKDTQKVVRQSFNNIAPKGFHDKANFYLHIVDKKQKRIVGDLWLKHMEKANMLFICNIFIYPHFRGLGYGQAVMNNIENHALKLKIPRIELNVFEYNKIAQKLYFNSGYQPLHYSFLKFY